MQLDGTENSLHFYHLFLKVMVATNIVVAYPPFWRIAVSAGDCWETCQSSPSAPAPTEYCYLNFFFIAHQGLGFQYFICTVLQCDLPPLRPHCMDGGPGLIFEPGTGSLEAGTLTTRLPHLLRDHHTPFWG